MAARIVNCAKLNKELPGIDEESEAGEQGLKMALLIGGRELADRIKENISAEAWQMWTDHMLMVLNEYRLDPTSDQANAVLKTHMEQFLFGEGTNANIDNYVPPDQTGQTP